MWTYLEAWQQSAASLGVRIEGECQVELTPDLTIRAEMLVKDFGAPKGTLVLPISNLDRNARDMLSDAGYAASSFGPYPEGAECSVAEMLEVLSDWGWASLEQPPRWLIYLNAETWTKPHDLFRALFAALDAPHWHGTNLDALYDSIVVGDINGLEPPFAICIFNTKNFGAEMQDLMTGVIDIFSSAERSSIPVLLRVWP